MTTSIQRLKAFIVLSIGVALSAYALFMTMNFMASARSVLMLGSKFEGGRVVPDRIIAALFLVFLGMAGVALIITAIKMIMRTFKK